MKKFLMIGALLLPVCLYAQKKELDHSVYDSWQSISNSSLSDDGRILSYQVTPQQGDSQLYFKDLASGKTLEVERGGSASLSTDCRWAVFSIKAPYEATRQARIDKKKKEDMPKDSLGIVDLQTLELVKVPDVGSFKTSMRKRNVIAYETKVARKDTSAKAKPAEDNVLVIYQPDSDRRDTLKHVGKYVFDNDAERLVVVFEKDKKDSLTKDEVVIYKLPEMSAMNLSEGKKFYSAPTFNVEGDKMAFLASADSNSTGNKHCSIYLYEEITTGKGKKAVTTRQVREIIPQDYTEGLPEGWCITENCKPLFSRASSRLFVGLSDFIPEKDSTIVDFEAAQLDIWNWDIYLTPPMQKARQGQLKTATRLAVINLADDPGRIITLGNNIQENFRHINGGESQWTLATDDSPYLISSTWDSNSYCDVYLVNLDDGSRKTIFTKLNGRPSLSSAGKYLVWYSEDDCDWYSYRISDGAIVNLTAPVGVPFYDTQDDHPSVKPTVDRPHWIEGDEAFLLCDEYDVWRFQPDGKKYECLTEGAGRQNDLQYRYSSIVLSDLTLAESSLGIMKPISRKETVYLTVFDRKTKENGIATIAADKPGLKSSFTDTYAFTRVNRARKAEVIAFSKSNFNEPADIYTTTDLWQTSVKHSSINPQQADYLWGDAQLVHWDAYDGTPLDGLLFTPEGLDKTRKYPMMIYFYEKNSETLYSYRAPAPSRSTINIPFYVSRGYAVFVPDIVYTDGHPGESAYNCICSGAEAMCEQFPFIDKDRMAIQGQSWGGYQTAYLVTRTDMFAAAGAGAPVGNMTSAYGGVRWESGMVRAMQYEHGQSRIGKSLWDEGGLELYIENSPIFHTENVTTPVLIMHNDNDGAVPWYQGIEFFMALRRFQHPAWLLEYNNESHNLVERRNTKDLSIRLQQFFDYYLKDGPLPAWMKTGVPTMRKGDYYGFENAE